MSGAVVVTDDGAVRTIRLNRPEKKNALTLAMYADMTAALHEANQTDAIRCVMFAGSPGAFCAGNDISDFLGAALGGGLESRAIDFMHELGTEPKAARRRGRRRRRRDRHHHAVSLRSRRRRGRCDVLDPFLKLGLAPELASTLLAPMRMGHARAFSLLVMGRPLTAAEARDAGIVNTVVDSAAVDAAAFKAAQEIAALPPGALAAARGLMRGRGDEVMQRIDAEAELFKKLLQSDEARAAFQAFFARKK